MFFVFEIATVMLVALTMALSVAHALELPGKMRLSKEQYLTVQPIYYPGFTIGGIGEALSVFATLALVLFTPRNSPAFWPSVIACVAMLLTQITYWIATHPVNNFWRRDLKLEGRFARFFDFGFLTPRRAGRDGWTALRDRWEYSHVARAVFSTIGLAAIVIAVSI